MNIHFQSIINAMLENYTFKRENLYASPGINNQVIKVCMNHHHADLLVGIGNLIGAAKAVGDYESMDEIKQIFHEILVHKVPTPLTTGA